MAEKVLITGGCGFIGSHIADKLVTNGYEVIIVDNLSSGKKNNISLENVTFFECSILDPQLEEIVIHEQPDYIIHQAAHVSVSNSIINPLYDEEINIRGSINVINSAIKANVKKVIYPSTAAVYGDPLYLPIDTAHPISPLSPYGVSKYAVEKYLEMNANLYGLDYTILRYSNVYGPRQDAMGEGGVISIFMDKMAKSKKLTIFGDGEQTRDFIYVEDVVDANIQALHLGSKKKLHVSSGKELSLNQLLNLMMEIGPLSDKPEYTNERVGDIKKSVLSNETTKIELAWEPKFTFKDGLIETYKFYSSNY
ncbi:NAD-dependent epimerase/dehydratase family protein [Lederbergia citrea]|uniref:NAD-dependent epimerase/dehydratase family protein n=1 Tax=Lederbergia citrea TaxID=2833581 RepID=UPI001BC8E69A|nr:NAD-dependent epimerase/dehydratase family protein [Lederbergia citrea]MBS4204770.1 NAD-dependent epimerase/dehydratase family protein [Lederbergia citrea]